MITKGITRPTNSRLPRRNITRKIVIHCAATPPDLDIGAEEIDRWHRERGWLMIGYHIVIRRDGTIEFGRDLDQVGAHVRKYNHDSLGICLVGGVDEQGCPEANFTSAQMDALKDTVKRYMMKYPEAKLYGHRDLDKGKACPSFSVSQWAKSNKLQ